MYILTWKVPWCKCLCKNEDIILCTVTCESLGQGIILGCEPAILMFVFMQLMWRNLQHPFKMMTAPLLPSRRTRGTNWGSAWLSLHVHWASTVALYCNYHPVGDWRHRGCHWWAEGEETGSQEKDWWPGSSHCSYCCVAVKLSTSLPRAKVELHVCYIFPQPCHFDYRLRQLCFSLCHLDHRQLQ